MSSSRLDKSTLKAATTTSSFHITPTPLSPTININKLKKTINIKTVLLICGYTSKIKIFKKIIPTTIIELICQFYQRKSLCFYLEQKNYRGDQPPIIAIASMDNNKNYKCILTSIDGQSIYCNHTMNIGYNSLFYVSDCKIPSEILSKNKKLFNNHQYDIIFSIGTMSDKYDDFDGSIMYIIDPLNIDTDIPVNIYYYALPQAPSKLDSSFAVYSRKHGLINVGLNGFFNLKFNEKDIKNEELWKWKEIKMNTERPYPAATMISDDKLFCCGDPKDVTEIYDFNNKIWIKLAAMNHWRAQSGICYDEFSKQKIYVAGGHDAEKTFEFYDINKNDWYLLSETNADHSSYPMVWNDNINIINIASSFGGLFEQCDIRENKWNVYKRDDDDNKSLDKLFGRKIKTRMTGARFVM